MIEDYLARIGLGAFPQATPDGLHELHVAQLFSVPFENLTVLLREPVELDLPSLAQKILRQRRGGYCFELNGLFTWALREAGFSVKTHLARVRAHNPEPGPLTHQISLVEIAGRTWLCDVGFGGPGIRFPMPFEIGRVDKQESDEFRLSLDPDHGYALELRQPNGEWEGQYYFHRNVVLPPDILMGNHFTATWENSIFRKTFLLAKPFPGGKCTMFGKEFKRREGTKVVTEIVAGPDHLREVLEGGFGISISEEKLPTLLRGLS